MMRFLSLAVIATTACLAAEDGGFQNTVRPVLTKHCVTCHNPSLTSGGVNLVPFTNGATVATERVAWEKILHKIESGEMPPKGVPRPNPAAVDALVHFLNAEFDKVGNIAALLRFRVESTNVRSIEQAPPKPARGRKDGLVGRYRGLASG